MFFFVREKYDKNIFFFNKLNNEIKTLQKQLEQTIIQKDDENSKLKELLENEIANLKKQSKDKITNLTKQSDSKIANLIKQSNDEITILKIQFERKSLFIRKPLSSDFNNQSFS